MTRVCSVAVFVAAVLCGGCATVNSERAADRMAAVRAISDEDALYEALDETSFADVRVEAVRRLSREDLLVRAAWRGDLTDAVREDAIRRIRSEDELSRFVVSSGFGEALRRTALAGIVDQARLCGFATNAAVPLALRRSALDRMDDPALAESLLALRPPPEDWICRRAVSLVADSAVLRETALRTDMPGDVRSAAAERVQDSDDLLRLFLESTDALPALRAIRGLPAPAFGTAAARPRALSLLDGLPGDGDAAQVLPLLDGVPALEAPGRQKRIADALLAADSSALRRFAQDNLFDSEAVERIALEGSDDLSVWALSLRPGEDAAARIAAGAKSVAAQCRALSLVGSRTKIEDIARRGRSRAVRLAAIDRLGQESRDVLAALSEDDDATVRTRALARLQNAVGTGDEEIGRLRERDEERRRRAERERADAERKAAAEEREAEQAFRRKVLGALGGSQIEGFHRYLAVREKAGLRDERTFSFTGQIEEISRGAGADILDSRRRVILAVRDESGRRFPVTIDLSVSLSASVDIGDVATFAGTFRSGDANQAHLVRGVLRSTGLPE